MLAAAMALPGPRSAPGDASGRGLSGASDYGPTSSLGLEAPAATLGPLALSGRASWYCLPGRSACHYAHPWDTLSAAAGPALRDMLGPDWRGQTVWAHYGGQTIPVTLVDWCQCYKGEPGRERLLDLYARAFRLTVRPGVVGGPDDPLRLGVVWVTLTL